MYYQIIDNFLKKNFYEDLSHQLKSENIPWFFKKEDTLGIASNNKNNNGFFSFCYYNDFKPDHVLFENHIVPILKQLDIVSCIQVRANLTFRDIDHLESKYHNDNTSSNVTTGIFYLTTCNAKTVLKINNKELLVDSVENRLLLFNSQIKHKVIYQNDCHKRYVINFNFIKKNNEPYKEII